MKKNLIFIAALLISGIVWSHFNDVVIPKTVSTSSPAIDDSHISSTPPASIPAPVTISATLSAPYMEEGEVRVGKCCKAGTSESAGNCKVEKSTTLKCVTPGGCSEIAMANALLAFCNNPLLTSPTYEVEGDLDGVEPETFAARNRIITTAIDGTPTGRKVRFTTMFEDDIYSVTIEKSSDLVNWAYVNTYGPTNGGGGGDQEIDDNTNTIVSALYYRLRSKVIIGIDTVEDTLEYDQVDPCNYSVSASPNPFTSTLDIDITNHPGFYGDIEVINLSTTSVVLSQGGVVGSNYQPSTGSWPSGNYQVKINFFGCPKTVNVTKL